VHICYVTLSPAFGMHQCTADLANLLVTPDDQNQTESAARVTVLTIFGAPLDRYAPQVEVRPIVAMRGTGLQRTSFDVRSLWRVYRTVVELRPDIVHLNAPHIWNPVLLWLLRRAGIRTVQTIHDLDPHSGTGYGRLLYVWNDLVLRMADQILVHGQVYRMRLIARGVPPERVTFVPLLMLFLGYDKEQQLALNEPRFAARETIDVTNGRQFALFFARIEAYKGVDVLIDAMRRVEVSLRHSASGALDLASPGAVIAGKGDIGTFAGGALPGNVELRNRFIDDDEATDLFSRCSLVVLPYVDATQSALIAAAYFFGKPVIVTRVGALPEYVINGETGWVIEPRNPQALAECLLAAFSNPARLAEMGEAGRAWYRAQRSIEHSMVLAMYRTMVGET
jgi:glycosyltransferase involved in cell wall biosynthesis